MERWFGKTWGAPVCEPSGHSRTPIGQACTRCREPIKTGDQGLIRPYVELIADGKTHATLRPVHLECFLRSIRPHGPECPHCRGVPIHLHAETCKRDETGLCTCQPMPPAAHKPENDSGERKV